MKRIQSLDILRGATMALMILVNNPGSWKAAWAPLLHAPWNGLTIADLVFPLFLFVMGVSMYLSLRKGGFKLNWKIAKRALLLIGIGLLLNLIGGFVRGKEISLLRFTGVLQRFGLCFGIAAVLVCTLPHTALPYLAGGILLAYEGILLSGNGFVPGTENILFRFDSRLIPPAHLYNADGVDPEGLLSTLPCIAHTLLGFLAGKLIAERKTRPVLYLGLGLTAAGLLASFWIPLNKTVWSPSFALLLCGLGTLILCGLYWLIDEKNRCRHNGFFLTFGTNAIYGYIVSIVLAWILDGSGFHKWYSLNIGARGALLSLAYAVICVLIVWLCALPLRRKDIYLKL